LNNCLTDEIDQKNFNFLIFYKKKTQPTNKLFKPQKDYKDMPVDIVEARAIKSIQNNTQITFKRNLSANK